MPNKVVEILPGKTDFNYAFQKIDEWTDTWRAIGEGKSLLHNLGYVNREWLDTPPEDIKKLNSAIWLFEDLE